MDLTFSTDTQTEPRHAGGVDITVSLTAGEAAALGADAAVLPGWMTSALAALVALRTGHIDGTPDSPAPTVDGLWYWVINDLDYRMAPRLAAIRDAVIRRYYAPTAPGSLGSLATAMDVERPTAQYRRDKVLRRDPSVMECWATGTPPALGGPLLPPVDPADRDTDPDLAAQIPPFPGDQN